MVHFGYYRPRVARRAYYASPVVYAPYDAAYMPYYAPYAPYYAAYAPFAPIRYRRPYYARAYLPIGFT